jgi:hypothetical protein
MNSKIIFLSLLIVLSRQSGYPQGECSNWKTTNPEWIFCDDFEAAAPLVGNGRYFEYDSSGGQFSAMPGVGVGASRGMRASWQQGQVAAGSIKLAFGKNPNSYMNKQNIRSEEIFRELYYRMYLRMEPGWQGNPCKLSRATCFTSAADWRQAMIAHLWSDDSARLLIDPARCVDDQGNVVCTTYNDFAHLKWIGAKSGKTPLFSSNNSGRWFCIEHHIKLNDPGQSNGIQEFWIDGNLEARDENLNYAGSYAAYGINAVFIENYWNGGSPRKQERYIDNFVVSTKPIGCLPVARLSPLARNSSGSEINVALRRSNGGIEIRLNSSANKRIGSVKVYASDGRKVFTAEPGNASNALIVTLPRQSTGIYYLTFGQNATTAHRLIIAGVE